MPSPNRKAVKTYLAPDEYLALNRQAAQAKLSLSTFIKKVCLNQEVKSKVDQEAVLTVMKANADLSRLGGLLKQILAQDSAQEDVRKLLHSLESTKNMLAKEISLLTQKLLK